MWNLVERIHLHDVPACSLQALFDPAERVVNGRAYANVARVVVNTDRQSFSDEVRSCDGDPWHPRAPNDWSWLQRKAANFLAEIPDPERWFASARSISNTGSQVTITQLLSAGCFESGGVSVATDTPPT